MEYTLKSSEKWVKMAENHLCCSSGLLGSSLVFANTQGAFIQPFTVHIWWTLSLFRTSSKPTIGYFIQPVSIFWPSNQFPTIIWTTASSLKKDRISTKKQWRIRSCWSGQMMCLVFLAWCCCMMGLSLMFSCRILCHDDIVSKKYASCIVNI